MTSDPDRRTYDVLRLLSAHEPIGSVHLTEHLRERGYSVTERTVRLTLAELDEEGLTEKAGSRGRRLTEAGHAELERGGVAGRTERLRERLLELTSHVTYDPGSDEGDLVVGTVTVPAAERDRLEELLTRIDESPMGPVRVSVRPVGGEEDADRLEVAVPSSVTIDGVLLSRGIDADLEASGVIEYHAAPDPEIVPYDDLDPATDGGAVLRFTDVIGDERATLDIVSLLIEAGRTDVAGALADERGLLVADALEFPLSRYETVTDVAGETRDRLGGVLDHRRPRETGPFPWGEPGWTSGTLTYAGAAGCVVARCVEAGIADEWRMLDSVRSVSTLEDGPSSGTY
ncbi:NrpR regulatory domain-containing protein [Halobiforma nitratireducens]|uniref:Ribonuclease R n=1 Tax=Halobiforma nitratireducens JCM 10879 TaxID=1227454 RepID=M0MC62_9EURY|nr:NrpR regulatory domain-containing protein [Halobiforma nitratireducens]EMA42923.1 ribonuclease R [Halobiforma nitratireducens JCM 10879]